MSDLIERQKAIEAVEHITSSMSVCVNTDECHGMKRMQRQAVIELANLPSAQPELCEDAVSRQRLLSDLKELVAAWKKYPVMTEQIKGVEAAIGYVESIPSVKPNSKELSETQKALDTISRQAAIDAAESAFVRGVFPTPYIRELPSAQPETAKRIVGKSRDGMTLWYQCDMCNEPVDAQDDFCRGCGRRLIDG